MPTDATSSQEAPVAPTVSTERLRASRNRSTGLAVFPQVPESSPSAHLFEPIVLSARGTLYSYTISHPNPKSGKPPFALGYVDFPEGARVFGRLQLPEGQHPQIGTAFEARGDGPDYRFVPAEGEAA